VAPSGARVRKVAQVEAQENKEKEKPDVFFEYLKRDHIAAFNFFQSVKGSFRSSIERDSELTLEDKITAVDYLGNIWGIFDALDDAIHIIENNVGYFDDKTHEKLAKFIIDFLNLYFDYISRAKSSKQIARSTLLDYGLYLSRIFKDYLIEFVNTVTNLINKNENKT
jgi:hypothetical protein